jgi:hypothetical protein
MPCESLRVKSVGTRQSDDCSAFFQKMFIVEPGWNKPLFLPFIPSFYDRDNMIAGCSHRYGRLMPAGDEKRQKHFRDFYTKLIPAMWDPIKDDDVPEYAEWLKRYPAGRRAQLVREIKALVSLGYDCTQVKAFIKHEDYEKYKVPRVINSYTDASKSLLGAIFAAVDKKTFQSDVFMKGIDPRDWAKKMSNLFGEEPVVCTDFTAFESHHQGALARVGYFWAMHMTRHLTRLRGLRDLIARLMLGVNSIHMGKPGRDNLASLLIEIDERLMSGAVWTSSENGVLNFVLNSYMAAITVLPTASIDQLVAWVKGTFRGLFEGDDGICKDYKVAKSLPGELGLILKLEEHTNFATAGFCSIYCDGATLKVVKDPRRVLRKFFAIPVEMMGQRETKLLAYFRGKAISYLVNFNGSPIITALCHAVCRLTRSVDERSSLAVLDTYARELLLQARAEKSWQRRDDVPDSSRLLVSELFDIPCWKQREIESSFDANVDGRFQISLQSWCNGDDLHNFENHLREVRPVSGCTMPLVPHPVIQCVLLQGKTKPAKTAARTRTKLYEKQPPVLLVDYVIDSLAIVPAS